MVVVVAVHSLFGVSILIMFLSRLQELGWIPVYS